MAGKSITGIFLAVEIDKQKTMDSVKGLLNSVKNTLSTSDAGSLKLDINDKAFTDKVSKAAVHLQTFQKMLEKQTEMKALGKVISDSKSTQDALQGMAGQAESTALSMSKLASKLSESTYLQNIGNVFHNLTRAMGVSGKEAVALAKELGATGEVLDYITARWTKYSHSARQASESDKAAAAALRETQKAMQAVAGIGISSAKGTVNITGTAEAKQALTELAAVSGMSEAKLRALSSVLLKSDAANAAASSYIKLANAMGLSGNAAVNYASKLGMTGKALQQVTQHFTAAEKKTKSLGEAIKNLVTTTSAVNALQSSLAVLGANLSIAGMVELGKSAIDVSIKVDSLRVAYESIYKSGFRAAAQLDYIRKVSKDLGLEFYSTAKGAKSFFAAMQTSKIAGDANTIFKALSGASSALKLTSDETNRVFLAVGQMVSKGKIQAEELRTQLGEVLPGAVQILARAMGIGTSELDKMLERGEVGIENLKKFATELEAQFGESAVNAANSLLSELNKLSTAWTDFKAALWKSDTATTLFSGLRSALEYLTKNIDVARASLKAFFSALTAYAVITGAVKSIAALTAGFSALRTAIGKTTFTMAGLRAGASALIGSLGPVAIVLSTLVGAGVALVSFSGKTAHAARSVSDFKELLNGNKEAFAELRETTESATEATNNFIKARAKAKLLTIDDDFNAKREEMENAIRAMEFQGFGTRSGVLGGSVSTKYTVEEYTALNRVSSELSKLNEQYFSGKITVDEYELAVSNLALDLTGVGGNALRLAGYISDVGEEFFNSLRKLEAYRETLKNVENGIKEVGNAAKSVNFSWTLPSGWEEYKANIGASDERKGFNKAYFQLKFSEGYKPTAKDAKKFYDEYKKFGKAGLRGILEGLNPQATKEQIQDSVLFFTSYMADATSKASKSTVSSTKTAADAIGELTKKVTTLRAELAGDKGSKFLASANEEIRKFDEKIKELTGKVPRASIGQLKALSDEFKKLKVDQAMALESKDYTKQLEEYSKFSRRISKEFLKTSGADGEVNILVAKEKMDNDLKQLEQFYNQAVEKRRQYEEKIKEFEASGDVANADKLRKQLEEQRITIEQYESDKAKIKAVYEDQALRNSENMFDQMKVMAQDYFKAHGNLAKGAADVMKNAADAMGNALGDFAAKGMRDFKSLSEAFSSMVDNMISEIGRLLAKQAVSGIFNFAGSFFGGSSGGNAVSQGMAINNAEFLPSFNAFSATGNVFSGGNLSAYSGSVVSRPTAFSYGNHLSRYARGAGLMGEAGPEAILPLTRDSRGRLGVTAQTDRGSSAQVVNNVNIVNYTGEKVDQRQNNNSSGGVDYEIIIGNAAARQISTPGTRANRAVMTQTSTSRPAIRR